MENIDITQEERIVAQALIEARSIQEFLWGKLSFRNFPYSAKNWKMVFQKRVDKIAQIDFTHPNSMVELRKRLLQQAALSIAALVTLEKEGL